MFSTQAHQNICSLKWKENWVVIKKFLDCQKCPGANAHGLLQVAFMFFFPSPLVCNTMPCCLFYLFCFSFLFFSFSFFFSSSSGQWRCLSFSFDFLRSGRRDFFLHDFYFSNKFGCLLLFCGYLSRFCFNWASFFKKDIWVNLFEHIFFIPPLFRSQPNKKKIK